MMRKRILSMFLVVLLVLSMLPATALAANTNVGGVVTINDDFTAGTLQTVVEATGVGAATNVTQLHITSSANGELDATDITYLNTMTNLTVLDVASNIVCSDVGDNFFRYHDKLTSVTFSATTFGDDAFSYCDSLISVDLPSATTFGNSAFFDCDGLTNVNLPSATTFGDYAFSDCDLLVSVDLPSATTFGDDAFEFCDALTSVNLPAATTFGDYAFYECWALTTVSLPSAETFGSNAFYNCALTSLYLPLATTFGNGAFSNCEALTTVSLPVATTFGNSAFYSCDALTTVSLPSATTFGHYAFGGCGSLTTVSLPNAETFGHYAFAPCGSLTSISLPSATTFGDSAFRNCISLTSISLPVATTFGTYAFNDCDALTSVSLPSAITFGGAPFSGCTSLTSISLPLATSFASSAFYDCDALTNVNLPSATTFGDYVFSDCDLTVTMTLGSTIPTAGSSTFSNYDPASKSADISVPYGSYDAYNAVDDGNIGDGKWWGWTITEQAAVQYIVNFDSNGGSAVDSQTINYGELASEPADPTKEGLTFGGWYSDEGLTTAWDFATDTVTENTTLYAKWTCTITYEGNENTGGTAPVDTTAYSEGANATTLTQNTLYKIGYTFDGWNTQSDGMGDIYISEYTFQIFENMTLYAMWDKNLYNVTYDVGANGSFSGETSPAGELVYYMESPDEVPAVVADEGYEFLYWEVNPVHGGIKMPRMPQYVTTEQIEAMQITSDIGFTAVYEALDEYTVTFESNAGSAVDSQTVYDGEKATEPTEPTKEGYIFNGWYSDEETTNLWNFDTDTVSADMTLYADWIVNNSGGAATTGGTITPATQTGSISLTLTDSSGNPLAYYPVELHSTVISGTTDGNGQVTFTDVTLEDHELVIFDKEGIELGTIYLTMSESDTNSTSINGTTVLINFNESAVSVSIEIAVEGTELVVETATINDNPKTGASELAVYIGEGNNRVNVIPYICLLFTLLLIGSVFIVKNHRIKQ